LTICYVFLLYAAYSLLQVYDMILMIRFQYFVMDLLFAGFRDV